MACDMLGSGSRLQRWERSLANGIRPAGQSNRAASTRAGVQPTQRALNVQVLLLLLYILYTTKKHCGQHNAQMFKCSCLIALLLLSAADALRGGGGAITGGSLVLKSGTQPVTPRSVVVLRGGGA